MADRSAGALKPWLAAGLVLLLAGCAKPVTDFGRPQPNQIVEKFDLEAWARPDGFNLTNQEREMHDRIWRYLTAPQAAHWFVNLVIGPLPMRLAPEARSQADGSSYYHWLSGEPYNSSRARYARLTNDISSDIAGLPGVFDSICEVMEIDRQRELASQNVSAGEHKLLAEIAARRADNERAVEVFVWALGYRFDSYGYALDHLLIETPHEDAIGSDRQLTQFGAYLEAARQNDFCAMPNVVDERGGAAITARGERSAALLRP